VWGAKQVPVLAPERQALCSDEVAEDSFILLIKDL